MSFSDAHPTLSNAKVHMGFLSAYLSIQDALLQQLQFLFALDSNDQQQPWEVYITGHSLGGALSTLLAFDLGRIRASLFQSPGNSKVDDTDATRTLAHAAFFQYAEAAVDRAKRRGKSDDIGTDHAGDYAADEAFSKALQRSELFCYNYGAPRVGNR